MTLLISRWTLLLHNDLRTCPEFRFLRGFSATFNTSLSLFMSKCWVSQLRSCMHLSKDLSLDFVYLIVLQQWWLWFSTTWVFWTWCAISNDESCECAEEIMAIWRARKWTSKIQHNSWASSSQTRLSPFSSFGSSWEFLSHLFACTFSGRLSTKM